MNLTEDQILTLAPDEASRKAGKDLANPNKWITKGFDEHAIWGECQGSGSKPYQTQIDTANIAFKCSCPSRKFPCKHGIALGLLFARQQALFVNGASPAWVAEWISKRAEKEEKKIEKKEKEVDEVAQAKRQQAREQKVADGIEELLRWIKDLVRNGIMNVPDKGYL
ncbi:MAG TPA: SWIM zinc finger family protein, partial [Flavisolibacter sp.]|nr:SWIM zinc finger family protein [Flavisolibacter sp.]